jgi:hypothetical protein
MNIMIFLGPENYGHKVLIGKPEGKLCLYCMYPIVYDTYNSWTGDQHNK